ncbi:MAG: tRNA 2-thiouridine(34) synthase MnmA [Clostridia bacterium]|nr:tRNA 2-thiouridine(34) synthase MnmA [Clostridia bacterium]
MSKVLVAMSGGVDSSAAAAILQSQGYDCIGCTLRLFDKGGDNADADIRAAESVCAAMGIPYCVFNYQNEFRDCVIADFVQNYIDGRTPNPCIVCNRRMKFGALMRRAEQLGCEYVATGHYARIERTGGRFLLKKALDPAKDQSYVLYSLTQEQLAHVLFPLGGMEKADVRALATENSFENAQKPESQDICFVPDGDYAGFIERFSGNTFPAGDVVDTAGNLLGRHRGLHHYTVGQRKGLGIAAEAPLYVRRLDAASNRVVLARAAEMFDRECTVTAVNWIPSPLPASPVRCKARIRYHHPEQPCTVIPLSADSVRMVFDAPVRAITPGQAAVFYDGDVVLGGGTISDAL